MWRNPSQREAFFQKRSQKDNDIAIGHPQSRAFHEAKSQLVMLGLLTLAPAFR